MKAVVTCGHKMIRIIYKVLLEKIHYDKEKNIRAPAKAPNAGRLTYN